MRYTEINKEYNSIEEMLGEIASRPWYKNIFPRIQYKVSEIKSTVVYAWQRVFRGYDDPAWWGIDTYISDLIPKLVKELMKSGRGAPISMFYELTPDENGAFSKEDQLLAESRWQNILRDIEEGFSEYLAFQKCELPRDQELVKFNRAFDLFREHFSSLWD